MRKPRLIPSVGSSRSPLVLWALIAFAVTSSRSHATGYSIIDLGPENWFSHALAINQCGQIAGSFSTVPPYAHAYLYDGSIRDLGVLGTGMESVAFAINSLGHAVGFSDIDHSARRHPFFYDGTQMIDLGSFGGSQGIARGINEADIIVGEASNGFADVAFLYDGTSRPLANPFMEFTRHIRKIQSNSASSELTASLLSAWDTLARCLALCFEASRKLDRDHPRVSLMERRS